MRRSLLGIGWVLASLGVAAAEALDERRREVVVGVPGRVEVEHLPLDRVLGEGEVEQDGFRRAGGVSPPSRSTTARRAVSVVRAAGISHPP